MENIDWVESPNILILRVWPKNHLGIVYPKNIVKVQVMQLEVQNKIKIVNIVCTVP